MSPAAILHKGSAGGSHAAKNGKSGPAAKRNNSAHTGTPADCGPLAISLSNRRNKTPSWFTMFAQKTAHLAGRPITFLLAVVTIVVWAVTGPIFGYSDTWQLVINTGTTIVTFLMVFLIQNSQNRDALAFQVKLDELIIKLHGAGNEIAGAEDLCDEDLEALHEAYKKRAAHAHDTLEKRRAAR
jgi:low affinity Fe/Cu permease